MKEYISVTMNFNKDFHNPNLKEFQEFYFLYIISNFLRKKSILKYKEFKNCMSDKINYNASRFIVMPEDIWVS